jgi:ribonuclease HII
MPKSMFICGDSFMQPIIGNTNIKLSHFTEILLKSYFYPVFLAQQGSSNFGICLQIETAIKYNADFVILNTTSFDRVDIPLYKDDSTDELMRDLNVFNLYHGNRNSLQKRLRGEEENPHIVSNSIAGILDHKKLSAHQHWNFSEEHLFDIDEKMNATVNYVKHLYDPRMKRQMDEYILYAALHKLKEKGIPFIVVLDRMNITNKCPWLEEKNMCDLFEWRNKSPSPLENDPGYHTYPHLQQEAADILEKHIRTHWSDCLRPPNRA